MKIGFDLDKVLVNHPPFIPSPLIDLLYKGHASSVQHYRIPTNPFEIMIRKVSHLRWFRPPMQSSINFLKKLTHDNPEWEVHLITSRFGFLKSLTETILTAYGIAPICKTINLNIHNEQPHLFKERVIKSLELDMYVDDDIDLLGYLADRVPGVKYVCYQQRPIQTKATTIPIVNHLHNISQFFS